MIKALVLGLVWPLFCFSNSYDVNRIHFSDRGQQIFWESIFELYQMDVAEGVQITKFPYDLNLWLPLLAPSTRNPVVHLFFQNPVNFASSNNRFMFEGFGGFRQNKLSDIFPDMKILYLYHFGLRPWAAPHIASKFYEMAVGRGCSSIQQTHRERTCSITSEGVVYFNKSDRNVSTGLLLTDLLVRSYSRPSCLVSPPHGGEHATVHFKRLLQKACHINA